MHCRINLCFVFLEQLLEALQSSFARGKRFGVLGLEILALIGE
jgi:hypothetical protein